VEAQLIGLAVQTYKTALLIALPMLMAGLVMGLLVSIFQAATQINEMTLTFVPKILVVIGVLIFIMPWMMNMIMEFTIEVMNLIPEFPF
jgi:flagellar biosynthetic protein FliQ